MVITHLCTGQWTASIAVHFQDPDSEKLLCPISKYVWQWSHGDMFQMMYGFPRHEIRGLWCMMIIQRGPIDLTPVCANWCATVEEKPAGMKTRPLVLAIQLNPERNWISVWVSAPSGVIELRVDQLLSEFGSLIPTPFAKILCRLPIFASPPRTSPEGMGQSNDEAPLALAIAPPPNETLEERLVREAAEAEAKRISDEIDEQIARDREQMKKVKRPMKLLLLGALCSAKSHWRGNSGVCFQARVKAGRLQL